VIDTSTTTLAQWCRDPSFPVLERGGNGREYRFQLSAVWSWMKARDAAEVADSAARNEQLAQMRLALIGGGDEADGDRELDPRKRAAVIDAELKAMQLARLRRELILSRAVQGGVEGLMLEFRTASMNLPDRIADAAGLTPAQTEATERVIAAMLEELEARVARMDFGDEGGQGRLT